MEAQSVMILVIVTLLTIIMPFSIICYCNRTFSFPVLQDQPLAQLPFHRRELLPQHQKCSPPSNSNSALSMASAWVWTSNPAMFSPNNRTFRPHLDPAN